MKSARFFAGSMFTLIVLVAAASVAPAQKLQVNASGTKTVKISDQAGDNQFNWTSDAPLEDIKGTAEGVRGSFTVNPDNVSSIRGTISAKVSTMKSGNATRDGHIRSSQWLNASKHPTISFKITSISNVRINGNKMNATATGTFSMNGVSKTMSIPFSLTYLDESAATRKRAPGDLVMITASFSVNLKQFNVRGAKDMIGSKVAETIEVEAQLFGATGL